MRRFVVFAALLLVAPAAAPQTFGPPALLDPNASPSQAASYSPQVTTDGAGNWVAAWWGGIDLGPGTGWDLEVLFSRSTDDGATWAAAAPLNTNATTDSRPDYRPQVTTDEEGAWVAVWYSREDFGGSIGIDPDILVARSTDAGATWTAPVPLNTNAATDSQPDDSPHRRQDGHGRNLGRRLGLS
jgi:hypothetical protein